MDFVSIISIFAAISGGANILTMITYFRTGKSQVKKEVSSANESEASALASMQKAYKTYCEDNDLKMSEMREEISMLHLTVQGYKKKCELCINNNATSK